MSSILLVLPPLYRRINDTLYIESQAANGLDRWAENFDQVVAASQVIPESVVEDWPPWKWVSEHALLHKDRLRLVELPWACSVGAFLSNYRPVKRLLRL